MKEREQKKVSRTWRRINKGDKGNMTGGQMKVRREESGAREYCPPLLWSDDNSS